MTQLQIAGLYAALNAIIMLVLGMHVSRMRGKTKINLGDGGNPELLRAIRAHGNNTEYVPFALILMSLLALQQASVMLLHGLGLALTLGRIAHGLGLSRSAGLSLGRGLGTGLTYLTILLAAVMLIVIALR